MKAQTLFILSCLYICFNRIHAKPIEKELDSQPEAENLNFSNETAVNNFLDECMNLQSMGIGHATLNFLNKVNEKLPLLTDLSLISLDPDYAKNFEGVDIRMNGIKELSISSIDKFPKNVYFGNVETLKLVIDGQFTDEWLEFLTKQINSELTKLELRANDLRNDHILVIQKKFNKLTQANRTEVIFSSPRESILVKATKHVLGRVVNTATNYSFGALNRIQRGVTKYTLRKLAEMNEI